MLDSWWLCGGLDYQRSSLVAASLLLAASSWGCTGESPSEGAPGPAGSSSSADGDSDQNEPSSGGIGGGAPGSGGGAPGSGGGAQGSGGGAQGSGGGAPGSGGGPSGRADGCKRGVAYGYHSVADMTALSAGVSWWYNWAFTVDSDLKGGEYLDLEVEYVPMIWGQKTDREAAVESIPRGAQTLLGFNEPNFGSQANLSATEAARLWKEVEEVARVRNLKLVSPAVNYCGGDCQDTDPFNYLDEFFAACANCRVDAIAMHVYVGCSPSGDNKAEWLIGHVENYKARYDLPLWLTEFACNDAQSMDQQQAFLQDAVEYLEKEPRIERYAWFAGRADNVPFVDLLGDDGKLTQLGEAYVSAPQAAGCAQ